MSQPVFDTSTFFEIAKGNVPGSSTDFIIAENPGLAADTPELIWDQTGAYTYLTADTQLFVSSSSAADTTQTLLITGLDDTYTEVQRTVTVNDQSQVAISGLMFRVHEMVNISADTLAGDVYLAESDTLTGGVPDTASKIKAKIVQGQEITHMGLRTVPAGKTLYVWAVFLTLGKNREAFISSQIRPEGGVFLKIQQYEAYQTLANILFTFPFAIEEKSDFQFIAQSSNAGTFVGLSTDMILQDN